MLKSLCTIRSIHFLLPNMSKNARFSSNTRSGRSHASGKAGAHDKFSVIRSYKKSGKNGTIQECDVFESKEAKHIPVMLREAMAHLNLKDGGHYIDCTFGGGGYTRYMLDHSGANSKVVGVDQDPFAMRIAHEMKEKEYGNRLVPVHACFGDLSQAIEAKLPELGLKDIASFDGIVFDLGVSSFQLDDARRGFSFRQDGPLDMRMSSGQFIDADLQDIMSTVQENNGFLNSPITSVHKNSSMLSTSSLLASSRVSAEELVNEYTEHALAEIIFKYGEERLAARIARRICECREQERIVSTRQLRDIIHSALPGQLRKHYRDERGIDPATKTFQGFRIFINKELEQLYFGLAHAEKLLRPDGRIVVVTYHSLEDRIVKRFFQNRSKYSNDKNKQDCVDTRYGVARKPIHKNQKGNVGGILPRLESLALREQLFANANDDVFRHDSSDDAEESEDCPSSEENSEDSENSEDLEASDDSDNSQEIQECSSDSQNSDDSEEEYQQETSSSASGSASESSEESDTRKSTKLSSSSMKGAPTLMDITRKVIAPSKQEILENPRSRSAKLRSATRTSAPARCDLVADVYY